MFRVLLYPAIVCAGLFHNVIPSKAVEVYLFRGAGDFSFVQKSLHFSKGIDKMAGKLNAVGIFSHATRWENTAAIYREIRERRPQSVAFIGHSMGALAALGMAKRMKKIGVRVAYVGLIDIPGPIGSVGPNVELAENFYHAFPVYGRLSKPRGHPGIVTNHYVFGQIHISMDDSSRIQNAMISAIWQADERDAKTMYASNRANMPEQTLPLDTTVTSSIGQFGKRVMNGISSIGQKLKP